MNVSSLTIFTLDSESLIKMATGIERLPFGLVS